MLGNQLYEFHQQEIQDLREAKERSLLICRSLKSLMEDIVRDEPFCADWTIIWVLDNEDSDESYLKPVEHLLEAIAEPLDIPIINSSFHSAGSSMKLRTAHRAALSLRSDVCNCLWDIWGRRHRNESPDSITAASKGIVQSHWHEIGKRLKPLTHFDFDVLMQEVEEESARALDRCRKLIFGVKAHAESEPRLIISDGEYPQAMVDGKPMAITPKQVDLLRLLLDANGEYIALTEHKFRSRDVEGLPKRIKDFVETQPGAGTRIPHDRLFAVKET